MNTEQLIKDSLSGSKFALEELTASIQDKIYYLSLRMLVNPDDAQEATQEILIKIITNLSTFQFKSQFNTWVYKVASNYLITAKKVIEKDPGLSFDIYKADLEQDLQDPETLRDKPDYQILLNEMRISCTMAMLLCLNRSHRMAYILGDILEMEHQQASEILEISKANYRKQISRARNDVHQFTQASCSLISNQPLCSCDKKLTAAIKKERINECNPFWAKNSDKTYIEIKNILEDTQQDLKSIALQKNVTHYKSHEKLSEIIEVIVDQQISGKYQKMGFSQASKP